MLTVGALAGRVALWRPTRWLLPLWFFLGLGYSTGTRPLLAGCSAVRQNRKTDRRSLPPSLRCHMPAGWSPIRLRAGRAWRESGWRAVAVVLAGMAALAVVLGLAVWPADDPDVVEHSHDDLTRAGSPPRRPARPTPRARLRHRRAPWRLAISAMRRPWMTSPCSEAYSPLPFWPPH